MTDRKKITAAELKEIFRYDPDTGKIYHKASENDSPWRKRFIGKEAFISRKDGYAVMILNGQNLSAHRVGWALHHGEFPEGWIDHINHKRDDNRLCNLREGPPGLNARNQKIHRDNTSGTTGVIFAKDKNRWRARITIDGKHKSLGSYKNIEDAIAVRKAAESANGYHPNHGSKEEGYL